MMENSPKSTSRPDHWAGRRVFVTGCTGVLGSWVCRELIERKADVVGLVRDSVPRSNLVTGGLVDSMTLVQGDIEDLPKLERVLSEYEIQSVFHLAAQAIVGIANKNPIHTFRTNIAGSWNVFEACRQVPSVQSVVVASSDKAYGTADTLPYVESMPLQGQHPYDVSKSCTDLLAQTYHATYGLGVCITRCGNFFGGGDLNFNRLVPGTIRSVLNDERPLIRSDGSMIRDYIYVRDVVEAYLLLSEAMQDPGIHGEAFNFSSSVTLSVLELTSEILRILGREELEPIILNEASNEIHSQYLSADKAKTRLNWSPSYDLETAIRETADWYRKYLGS